MLRIGHFNLAKARILFSLYKSGVTGYNVFPVINKALKLRRGWLINPATRVKKNKKAYSRQKAKLEAKRMINGKE